MMLLLGQLQHPFCPILELNTDVLSQSHHMLKLTSENPHRAQN